MAASSTIHCTYNGECSEGCSGFSSSISDSSICAQCRHTLQHHPNAAGSASVGLGLASSTPVLPPRNYSAETRNRLSVYRQSVSQTHSGNGLDPSIRIGSLGVESKGEHPDDEDREHRRRNTELILQQKRSDVLPVGSCSFGGDHECHLHATTTGKVCCVLLPIFGWIYCFTTRKRICHKCETEIPELK